MILNEIKSIEISIKENIKNTNKINKLFEYLENKEKTIKCASINSLRRLFIYFIEKGHIKSPSLFKKINKEGIDLNVKTALCKYNEWLYNKYLKYIDLNLKWIESSESYLQISSIKTLMELVQQEKNIKDKENENDYFGNETFARLIRQMIIYTDLKEEMLETFKVEYFNIFADVQYYTLKNVIHILDRKTNEIYTKKLEKNNELLSVVHIKKKKRRTSNGTNNKEVGFDSIELERICRNIFTILKMANVPNNDNDLNSFLIPIDKESKQHNNNENNNNTENGIDNIEFKNDDKNDKKNNEPDTNIQSSKSHQSMFSKSWMTLLRLPLPKDIYKKVLIMLPDKIMPFLDNPLLLSDFLTDSYNMGGIHGLLALNSLFILIHEHNFDYPNFYNKLYQLIKDDSLLHSKHRGRFFHLLSIFLSSTHLPTYLVAAFAKRLSRLTLSAPPGAILFIIPFVYNLIIRHKDCLQLIHRFGAQNCVSEQAAKRREFMSCKTEVDKAALKVEESTFIYAENVKNDPFVNDEEDPAKSKALESSLWELYSMKYHYCSQVSLKVKIFEEKLKAKPFDLDDLLEISYEDLFEQSYKRKINQNIPLEYKEFNTLFESDSIFNTVFAI